MGGRVLAVLVLAVGLVGFWVWGCSGPKPVVADVQLTPPSSAGAPYHLEVLLRNEGIGQGQVETTIRLRDRATGRTLQQSQKAELRRGETILLVADLPGPPGDYVPEVTVDYPPG
jgi:hypothetical protein